MENTNEALAPLPVNPVPPKRAFGRSLSDFPSLSVTERQLVTCCANGEECRLGNGERPTAPTNANTIRAELIRFLALGGELAYPVHEEGVMLLGGWIKGTLNLHQAQAVVRLALVNCHFDSKPNFVASTLPELALVGSNVPSMDAGRMVVKGSVYLNDGFIANGQVHLLGAQIGSNLECGDGSFVNPTGYALSADRIVVKGNVLLNNGFRASGEVRLPGAQIEGQLVLSNGSFQNPAGDALSASGITVKGRVFMLKANIEGAIDFATGKLGALSDDQHCWEQGEHVLDGLQYDRIIDSPTDAKARIQWLKRQRKDHLGKDFKPQPWEQLIKVFREMGHPEDAAKVAIAKQNQWRLATSKAKRQVGEIVSRFMHWVYGWFAGYGHRPIWTVYWMAGIWFIWSLLFLAGAYFNYIGPSTPLLNSPTLAPAIDKVCGHAGQPDKQNWTECSEVPAEYSTFQPFVYSLDLILPLVDLQQDSDWAPIVEDPPGTDLLFGVILRWMMWFEILFGWIASLTLVAVLGRLVEKD